MLDDRRALDSYLNSRSPTVKDVQGHFVKDVLGLDKVALVAQALACAASGIPRGSHY